MIGAYISAGCGALACWLVMLKPRAISRLIAQSRANKGEFTADADAAWTMLVLRMVQVALRQGTSVPRALEVVGAAIADSHGLCLKRVGESLSRGVSWSDAWRSAMVTVRASATAIHSTHSTQASQPDQSLQRNDMDHDALNMIRAVLESAWLQGDSPGVLIDAAIEQLDRDERARIERDAARLSVRLLLPTGLCFLPSFIIIGVLPVVISFLM